MRRALVDLGLFETRFGWAELPERGAALVSGPPEYVELVARVLAALPIVPADQQLHVFRLKHVPVDDRVIQLRDKQITTPGVATILRNLITGNLEQIGTRTALIEMSAPLRSMPVPVPVGGETVGPVVAAGAVVSAGSSQRRGVIQSDPRQNAIIVRDAPERIPVYEKLLAFLDQPSALIEIEALILDVNRSKIDELASTGSRNRAGTRRASARRAWRTTATPCSSPTT
jgi:type III secretion protein C